MMVSSLHMVVVLVTMLVVASSALSSNPDDAWPLGEERIEPVICYGPDKNKTWSKMNVDMAWRELQSLMNAPLKTLDDKGNPFPGVFNITNFTKDNPVFSRLNSTTWTGCQPGQPDTEYLQFPIADTAQGMKYKGGAPEQDRVLALARGKGSGDYKTPMYCGVITTRGASKKGAGFLPCVQRVKAQKVTLAVPSLPPITGEGNSMFAKRDEMPRAVTCSGDGDTKIWGVEAVQSAFNRIPELMNKEKHEKPQDWKWKPFPGPFHTYEPNLSPQVIACLELSYPH